MRRIILVAVLVLVGATVLAACGGGDNSSGNGMGMGSGNGMAMGGMDGSTSDADNRAVVEGAREIEVTGEDFSFEPDEISVQAGEDVTIAFTAEDIEHDVTVKGVGHVVHATKGETEMGGLRIDDPGTYAFWCSIPGHKAAGMTGAVVVT